MALGSILLQPQVVDRLQTLKPEQAFADDLIALLHHVLLNPEQAQSVGPAFARAFDAMGERLRVQLEPRLERALDELRQTVAPFTEPVRQLAGQDLDSPLQVLDLLSRLLEPLVKMVQELSEPKLRALVQRLYSLVSDTLGLNQNFLKEELRQVFGTARGELLAGVEAMEPRRAGIHLALAALLGRIESQFVDQWPTLDFRPDRLAHLIMQGLTRSGLEELRAQLACLLEKARATLSAGSSVLALAQPSVFGPRSVGAAQARPPLSGDRYCWYASWLYATRRRELDLKFWTAEFWTTSRFWYWLLSQFPGFPSDEVWVSEDRTQLILRRPFKDDEVLHESSAGNLQWQQAPQFTSTSGPECFTFGRVSPGFLETWTWAFSVLVEFAKGTSHIISCAASPKEYAANIPLVVWNYSKTFGMCLAEAPLPSYLTKAAGWGLGSQWLYLGVPWLSVILGSLEGKHTKATGNNTFAQWLTLLGGDALNAFQIHAFASGAHEVMLSFWTLLNYDGPPGKPANADTRPKNREGGGPIIGLTVTGANWLLCKLIPREDYAHPFHPNNSRFYLYWLLCAPLMGVAGGLLGTFLTWAISRTHDWKQLGIEIGAGAFRTFATFMLQQYSTMEGDTDGGQYNPRKDRTGADYSPARQPFAGYPPGATSPYKLPYEKGTALYVGQANQGMFSHMRFNSLPQIYAYDFAHDFNDDILASRAGTVVDFFDWIPDNVEPDSTQQATALTDSESLMGAGWRSDTPGWNFIIVRHDTAAADHDKDVNGQATTTYAVYGHGKNGSVREVFNARGVAPGAIIGTQVQQGQVIMKADDTGVSFHNHLHMHVRGGPAPPVAPTPSPTPIASSSLTPYTLPFVFREVRHILGRDGVLRNLTWYKSDNDRVT